jgi:Flp pilus assembly protein TadD
MTRSLARLAATLLVGVSIAACSSPNSASDSKSAANSAHGKPSTSRSLASDIDAQVRAAQALRLQGDYAGATKALAQLMLVAPDNANVVGEYGKALVQQGRPHDALDFLNRAVQLQSADWTLYSAMGVAYDQDGDYTKARVAYTQALALKPGNPGVLNNYALSRMQAGDLVGAHQLLAQASAAASTDPKIARNAALLASLSPAQPAAPAKPAPVVATRTPAPHATVASGTVVMQQVPVDAKAGPVKAVAKPAPTSVATSTPHPVTKEPLPAVAMQPKSAPASVANNAPRQIVKEPQATVAQATAPAKVAPKAAPAKVTKVAKDDSKKSSKDGAPTLRMTADAASP